MNHVSALEVSFKQRDMLRAAEQRRLADSIRRTDRHPSRIARALGLRYPAGR